MLSSVHGEELGSSVLGVTALLGDVQEPFEMLYRGNSISPLEEQVAPRDHFSHIILISQVKGGDSASALLW